MKDIAIYGAGGFGREVACLIKKINEAAEKPIWNLVGFFDDGIEPTEDFPYGPILGGINVVNGWSTPLDVVISIGTPQIIEKIVNNIINDNIEYPNILAPDCIWSDKDSISIGKGNIFNYGCCFTCNIKIGDFNQFNGFVTVGHDAIIGNFNSMMGGVRISGEVKIGNSNYWGFNSGILQQLSVGNNVIVGAGAILYRKPKDGNTYVGVPAKILKY